MGCMEGMEDIKGEVYLKNMDITNKYKGIQGLGGLLSKYAAALKNNVPPNTLFDVEPKWELLNEKRCPICANKLILPRTGRIAFCKGYKHGDKVKFVISRAKLEGTLKIK